MKHYKFNFKDENGDYAGWNDIQASNKNEAYEKAVLLYNHTGRDFEYDVYTDETCRTTEKAIGRNKGMFVDKGSITEINVEQRNEIHRLADLMSR